MFKIFIYIYFFFAILAVKSLMFNIWQPRSIQIKPERFFELTICLAESQLINVIYETSRAVGTGFWAVHTARCHFFFSDEVCCVWEGVIYGGVGVHSVSKNWRGMHLVELHVFCGRVRCARGYVWLKWAVRMCVFVSLCVCACCDLSYGTAVKSSDRGAVNQNVSTLKPPGCCHRTLFLMYCL